MNYEKWNSHSHLFENYASRSSFLSRVFEKIGLWSSQPIELMRKNNGKFDKKIDLKSDGLLRGKKKKPVHFFLKLGKTYSIFKRLF